MSAAAQRPLLWVPPAGYDSLSDREQGLLYIEFLQSIDYASHYAADLEHMHRPGWIDEETEDDSDSEDLHDDASSKTAVVVEHALEGDDSTAQSAAASKGAAGRCKRLRSDASEGDQQQAAEHPRRMRITKKAGAEASQAAAKELVRDVLLHGAAV